MYLFKQIRRTPVKTIFFIILIIIVTCLLSLGILMNIKSKSEIKNANKNFFANVKIENIDSIKDGCPATDNSITIDEISDIMNSKYVNHKHIEKKMVGISDDLLAYHGTVYQSTYDIYNTSIFEIEIISNPEKSTCFLTKDTNRKNNYGYRYRAKVLNVMSGNEKENEIEVYIDYRYDKNFEDIFHKGKKYIVCANYLQSDMNAKFKSGESKAYEFRSLSYYMVTQLYNTNKTKNYGVYEIKDDNYKMSDEYKKYKALANACYYADREQNISYLSCTNDSSVFRNKKTVLTNGRDITTEEYENGKHVCLVSNKYYYKNHLKLGDKISLKLRDNSNKHVSFRNSITNIEDLDKYKFSKNEYTYEIVGVYEGSYFRYGQAGDEFALNTIFVPEKTFPKEFKDTYKLTKCSPLQLSIRLISCKYKTDFMLNLKKTNLNLDKYNVAVETNGAENIYDTFTQMEQTSNILLISCIVISNIILFFIVFLFISKRKTEMAIMTALGTKKRSILSCFLLSVVIIVLIGTLIGIVIGFNLGKAIINTAYEKLKAEMSAGAQFTSLFNREFTFNNFQPILDIPFKLPIIVFIYNIIITVVMALVAIKVNLNKEPIALLTIKEN